MRKSLIAFAVFFLTSLFVFADAPAGTDKNIAQTPAQQVVHRQRTPGDTTLLADVKPSDELTPAPVSLFAGKKLDDFDFYLADNGQKEEVFALSPDGVLSIKGKPFGWLSTRQEYTNFTLALEYRWPEKAEPTNSGVFLRLNGTPTMFLPRTFEVQLQHGNAGDLYGFHGMKLSGEKDRYIENLNHVTGELRGVKKHRAHENKPGEWNELYVICFEGLILVKLNDRIVNWAHEAETLSGKIGFQSEGGPVEFRNAILTELK